MSYDFYIDGDLLPIPPPKMQVKIQNQNTTVTLINEGEVNLLKKAGLTEISFTAILPQVRYPFAVYTNGFQKADFYLEKLESLKVSQKPFQFIVSRALPNGTLLFDTNIKVSLEEYKITEDAKSGFDVNVDINLKQYRDYSTKTVQISNPQSSQSYVSVTLQQPRPASTAPQVNSYTVVAGDCLWNIAKKFYGNGSLYTKIADSNKDIITSPNFIYPGQVLVIPEI